MVWRGWLESNSVGTMMFRQPARRGLTVAFVIVS
jgi:hypothetical protein